MGRVVITGMGVISPVGNTVARVWQNLCEGVCGIHQLEMPQPLDIPVAVAAQVKDFDPIACGIEAPMARKADRYTLFALAAAIQAFEESGLRVALTPEDSGSIPASELGVYIGSGIGGISTLVDQCKVLFEKGPGRISPLFIPMMIGNMGAAAVAMRFQAEGPCLPVVTACATSSHAVGEAYRAVAGGYAKAILAGGSEAAILPLALGGFNSSHALSRSQDPLAACLPFDKRRAGFVMGEGACVLMLEDYDHAVARGARMYAEVCGYGNTCDAHHYTAPRPDGAAAARAMMLALEGAGYDASRDVLYINAHGTGTPLNDASETAAIKVALGEETAVRALVSSTKSMTGHMLGAAGAMESMICALALHNGVVPPTIGLEEPDPECDLNYCPHKAVSAPITVALSNSLGFGGHNASVAFRKL